MGGGRAQRPLGTRREEKGMERSDKNKRGEGSRDKIRGGREMRRGQEVRRGEKRREERR